MKQDTVVFQNLSVLSREELLYKELYLKDPDIYREPVESWDELMACYKKHGHVIPDHAPTAIKDMFLEDDLFLEKGFSVAVINHARYGPPFLHQHSFIKLIYVLQGSCTQITEKNRICMKAGDFCIVTPRVTNTTFSCNDEDMVINILMRYDTFSTAFLSLLTEQDVISDFFWQMMYRKKSNQLLMFQNVNDPVLDGIVIDIYNELVYEGSPSNLMLKGYIILFFGNVLRKHIEKAAIFQNITKQYKILPKVLEYMNEHVSYITLPALSEHFHLSTGHTSRMVKYNWITKGSMRRLLRVTYRILSR
jgi:hypothetical protein